MPESSVNQNSISTSTNLLGRVRSQDEAAWERFAEIYTPLVFSWVRSAGLQNADIADVVQEVFCIVTTKIDNYRIDESGSRFRPWLWGITRNVLKRFYRSQVNMPVARGGSSAQFVITQAPEFLEQEEAPNDQTAEKSLIYRAMMAIKVDFDPKTWQAFWRMTVDSQSAADVAFELGMNTNSVRQAKYRVLCRMREELGGG